MNVKRFAASAALVAGTLGVIPAFGGVAAAQPQPAQPQSDNAGCAGVITHQYGPPPSHSGALVRFVAHEEHGECSLPGFPD